MSTTTLYGGRVGARLLLLLLALAGFVFVFLFVGASSAQAVSWNIDDCTSCHIGYPEQHPIDGDDLNSCFACHSVWTTPYPGGPDPHDPTTGDITKPANGCISLDGGCHVGGYQAFSDPSFPGHLYGFDPNQFEAEIYEHGFWLGDDPFGPYDYWPESPLVHYANQTGYGPGPAGGYTCDYCHSDLYPDVYQHDVAALEAAHESNIAGTGCEDCHSNQLAEEPGHTDCATCHASTSSVVITAIAEGYTGCGSCHAGFHVHTWSYPDYYSWTTRAGDGSGPMLAEIGDNPFYPGVHGNYTANTAKCGICHSVHRAAGDGVKLLPTADATCAGCHRAGATTVTEVVVSWETGGPHGSGNSANCTQRACHMDNPHGAGGSEYVIVAAKLLNPATDVQLAVAAASPASGITTDELNALGTWDEATRSAVRTGYNCNIEGCHFQTLLAVLQEGYSEDRWTTYNDPSAGFDGHGPMVAKTGHLSVAAANDETAFSPVDSCISCHDQTDAATMYDMNGWSTVSGYTFPHSQTPVGDSNTGPNRAWLWMTIAANAGGDDFGYFEVATDKAKDGACLKCHRAIGDAAGIGVDR